MANVLVLHGNCLSDERIASETQSPRTLSDIWIREAASDHLCKLLRPSWAIGQMYRGEKVDRVWILATSLATHLHFCLFSAQKRTTNLLFLSAIRHRRIHQSWNRISIHLAVIFRSVLVSTKPLLSWNELQDWETIRSCFVKEWLGITTLLKIYWIYLFLRSVFFYCWFHVSCFLFTPQKCLSSQSSNRHLWRRLTGILPLEP